MLPPPHMLYGMLLHLGCCLGFRASGLEGYDPPIMENQMEKKMETEMETGFIGVYKVSTMVIYWAAV